MARVGGFLIDLIIVWAITSAVSIPLDAVGLAGHTTRTRTGLHIATTHGSGLAALVLVVIVLVYCTLFYGSARGQTPGMMAVGARVADRDTGGSIGYPRALGRAAFQYLMFVIFFLPWVVDVL
ncbi:MAG: RDD family protein, partial [Acidimicrobiales bacterium]